MRVNWFYIRMLILLLVTGFLLVFSTQRNNARQVAEIAIAFDDESTPFVTRETVNKLLIVSNDKVTGTHKENIALSKMEAGVKSHPIIKNAEVYVTMSGEVGVSVEQRSPIARIQGKTSFYIDENGEEMPLSSNFSARVPLVVGATKDHIAEVHKLTDYLRKDDFLAKHIVGIERLDNGEYVLQPRKLEYTITLGTVSQLDTRFSNYKAFYQKALKDKSYDTYKTIVLKYEGQVVCERK